METYNQSGTTKEELNLFGTVDAKFDRRIRFFVNNTYFGNLEEAKWIKYTPPPQPF